MDHPGSRRRAFERATAAGRIEDERGLAALKLHKIAHAAEASSSADRFTSPLEEFSTPTICSRLAGRSRPAIRAAESETPKATLAPLCSRRCRRSSPAKVGESGTEIAPRRKIATCTASASKPCGRSTATRSPNPTPACFSAPAIACDRICRSANVRATTGPAPEYSSTAGEPGARAASRSQSSSARLEPIRDRHDEIRAIGRPVDGFSRGHYRALLLPTRMDAEIPRSAATCRGAPTWRMLRSTQHCSARRWRS